MNRSFALLWTAICLALVAGTLSQESDVQALPAELNQMVVLPCQQPVTEDQSCLWMHGNKMITNFNVQLNPGYMFIGDLESGDCRLEIASVKIEDDGAWRCSKLSSAEGFNVNVTVRATPSENYLQYRVKGDTESKLLDKTPVMVQAEETYEVDCISQNGRPAVTSIEWFVNNNPIDNASPPDIQSDDGLFTVKSTYQLSFQIPDAYRLEGPDDKEKEITCVIYHVGFPEGKHELTATFGEQYKTTKVTIRDAKGPGEKSGNIICEGDGIPEPNYEIQIHNENDMWETVYYSQRGNVTTSGIYRCEAIYINPNNLLQLPPVFSQHYDYTSAARKSYLRYRLSDDEDYKSLNNEAVVLVQPGNTVYLECGSHSSNSIKIQWYTDDFIAKDDEENSAVSKARSTYRYTVPTADTCHRNGSHIKITCVIHYSHFTSDVIKIGATLGTQYKTTWVEIHYDEDVEEKTGNVVCKADGIPEPAYEIQFLEDNYAWTTVHCGRKGVVAQSGRYRCAATYVDPITKQKDTLTSKLFYEYHGRTPANYLMYALNDEVDFARLRKEAVIVVRPAEHVSLRCVSTNGRPKPTEIQWYEDGIFQRADTGKELHSEPAEYDTKAFTVWSLYNLSFPSRNDQSSNSVDRKGINEKKITCAIFHNGFTKGANKITAIFGEKYRTTSVETLYSESKDRKTGNIFCKADGIPEPMYDIQRHENKDVWISMHAGKNITITKRGSYRCAATYKDPDTHQVEEPIPSNLFYRYETS